MLGSFLLSHSALPSQRCPAWRKSCSCIHKNPVFKKNPVKHIHDPEICAVRGKRTRENHDRQISRHWRNVLTAGIQLVKCVWRHWLEVQHGGGGLTNQGCPSAKKIWFKKKTFFSSSLCCKVVLAVKLSECAVGRENPSRCFHFTLCYILLDILQR